MVVVKVVVVVKVQVPGVKVPGEVRVGVQTLCPPNQNIAEPAIIGMGKKVVANLGKIVNTNMK